MIIAFMLHDSFTSCAEDCLLLYSLSQGLWQRGGHSFTFPSCRALSKNRGRKGSTAFELISLNIIWRAPQSSYSFQFNEIFCFSSFAGLFVYLKWVQDTIQLETHEFQVFWNIEEGNENTNKDNIGLSQTAMHNNYWRQTLAFLF